MNNQIDRHDYTARYSLMPFCYWGVYACIASYASFYLLSVGFTNATIGMIIAVSGIFSAVFQPIVASYADKPESISIKKIMMMIVGLQVTGFIILFLIHQKNMLLSGILYATELSLHQLSTPLINSLGMEMVNQGKKLNFGVGRAIGSLGYAVCTFLLGLITAKADSVSVIISCFVLLSLLELFLFLFPFVKVKKTEGNISTKAKGGIAFFRQYKRFGVVLIGCILLFLGHIIINNFTLQVVQSKGGGTAEMGTAQAIASMLELPIMFLFGWCLKKASSRTWFRITGIFFFVKILATMFAPNMAVFYAVQVFQMFGWGLISVASVIYVNSIMEEQDKIKGQAYYSMTFTIGTVLGSFLGGALLDGFSVAVMLGFGSVVSLIGAVIVFFAA